MEEAAQVLEVETVIPMLLQKTNIASAATTTSSTSSSVTTACFLKRVVLIGDHHQLPPVVKHAAFQRHAHLDQVSQSDCDSAELYSDHHFRCPWIDSLIDPLS